MDLTRSLTAQESPRSSLFCSRSQGAQSVRAIPTLTLTSGADTQTTQDLDGDGIIEFSGTVGNFDLNFTIGLTKPTLGTAADPWMDVISLRRRQ